MRIDVRVFERRDEERDRIKSERMTRDGRMCDMRIRREIYK